MARPIPLELAPRDPREELRKRLEAAPAKHAEALLDSYELLQQLHDHGVFKLLRGALGASDKLVATAVDAAKSEESIRAIRNVIILGKTLASINPEVLECVGTGSRRDPRMPRQAQHRAAGPLNASQSNSGHKERRRSIALFNRFLENLGNQMKLRGGCE